MKVPKGQKTLPDAPRELQARLGAAVKAHRQRLGVTQEELAWRADLHRSYVADIERGGRNLTLQSINNLARALQVSASKLLAEPCEAPVQGGVGEILLIEDNPADAELTMRAFQHARFTNPVRHLRDGAAALDHLLGTGARTRCSPVLPQLILLDLNLPKVSGLDVLRLIKGHSHTRDLPVVVLTVSRDDRNIIECGRLGAENYIVKPVDFESLSRITPRLDLHWTLVTPHRAEPSKGT